MTNYCRKHVYNYNTVRKNEASQICIKHVQMYYIDDNDHYLQGKSNSGKNTKGEPSRATQHFRGKTRRKFISDPKARSQTYNKGRQTIIKKVDMLKTWDSLVYTF